MTEGTEEKPGEEKSGEEKSGEEKSGEEKPGEEKSGEEKPGEEKPGEETVLTAGSEEKPGDDKPIEYTDFKVPEGMEMDKDALAAFLPLAQEQKLSQEDAQKHIDIYAAGHQKAIEANAIAWTDLKKTWVETARSDKEIGGERYDESVKLAKLAIDKLGTKELVTALETTGFGDNPEFIRIFSKVGKIVGADDFNFGGAMGEGSRNRAEIMYGTPAQQ